MPDDLRDLVRDTLLYMKNSPLEKESIFAYPEDFAFFQKNKELIKIDEVETEDTARELSHQPERQNLLQKSAKRGKDHAKIADPEQVKSKTEVHKAATQNLSLQEYSQFQTTLQKIAPSLKLTDHIPDDREAKRISSAWKEKIADVEVVLLICDSHDNTLEFLKGVAKAIDQHLAKTKILMAERLEREKRWDLFLKKNTLRLIIASDAIQKLPELMRFFKSVPAQAQFFLDKTPLLILSAASMYKSSEHKAALWKMLCQMLKT
jgi:hypothetical protein